MLSKAFIPYKGYYSTPFCRWQGAMANENAIVLGAKTAARWMADKGWEPGIFDYLSSATPSASCISSTVLPGRHP
jgi:hypothetical protein